MENILCTMYINDGTYMLCYLILIVNPIFLDFDVKLDIAGSGT